MLQGSQRKYTEDISEEEKTIRLAQTLAEQGFISKSCKTLGKNKLLDGSDMKVKETLKSKHPPGDYLLTDPPLIVPPFFAEDVEKVINRTSSGSAACWSGWTKELVQQAAKATPRLFEAYGIFLAKIQACNDPKLLSFIRAGKLIALNNAKNANDEPDPRPITISDYWTKVLGTLAMEKSRYELPPCQRGVCHKGGTHQAIVEIQRAYDDNKHLGKTCATFDVKNAFNSTLRSAIKAKLDTLGESARFLLEYFRFMYGTSSDIFIRAKQTFDCYHSQTGVRQGDMPASLLFALVFSDAAVAAGLSVFDTDVMKAMWLYLDDVTVIATTDEIIAFMHSLSSELKIIGLSLNLKKCRVLADPLSDVDRERLLACGFQLDFGCTRVLGSPVGEISSCKLWITQKVNSWSPFWSRICHPDLHPSTALILLSRCGNVKFEHLAKSLHPDVISSSAKLFDSSVESAARTIIGARNVDNCLLRSTLHLKVYEAISPALYQSTLSLIQGERFDVRAAVFEAMCNWMSSLSQTNDYTEPIIRSTQGQTAADTFHATTTISAHDFVQGLRMRCAIAPAHIPVTCSCGFLFGESQFQRPAVVIGHLLTCPHNCGENKTTRHHRVVHAIKTVLFAFGHTAIQEPGSLHQSYRPDLQVISTRTNIIIDVTIVDDVIGSSSALDDAAKEKHDKYDNLAEHLHMSFFALPMSSYGRLHEECRRFVNKIAMDVNSHRRADFRREILNQIQQALLEGNSRTLDRARSRLCGRGNWLV